MKFLVVPVVLSLGGALLFACNASAQVQFDLDLVFEGTNTPPANASTPWITATFQDWGVNQVRFTLQVTGNLTGTENVQGFYFNFDDALNLGALSRVPVSSIGSFALPGWTFDENNLKADGDGTYDVLLDFATGSDTNLTFGQNESISYLLTYGGPESVTENSFDFFSQPAGGKGPFLVAAHIQNTTDGGSAWLAADTTTPVPVPEPSGAALLCLIGGSLLGRRQMVGG